MLREERKKQDIEDEIISIREHHTELLATKGRLEAEAEAQRVRIAERETMIREVARQYSITLSQQSLEREQVVEFSSRIQDVQRRLKSDFERLQQDLSEKNTEYHSKIRRLENEAQTYKAQRQTLREQLLERQSSIRSSDRLLEDKATLQMAVDETKLEIEEKRSRIEKIKADIANAKYDEKIQEKVDQARNLEAKREELLEQSKSLSMQADSRAKVDLKRSEVKTKQKEIDSM